MRPGRWAGRQALWSLAASTVLAVSGVILIGAALASQEEPSSRSGVASGARLPRPKSDGRHVPLARSRPVSLDIPAIGVHSSLLYVGLDEEGRLQVPPPGPHYDDAAWYKYSPMPGELGPAIIVGHVDSAADGPSVFFDLGALRPRDRISVGREDGRVATFEVDAVRRFSKRRFPTQLVYGPTDDATLRLITCGGAFDDATGHYVDNIVVFASLIRISG